MAVKKISIWRRRLFTHTIRWVEPDFQNHTYKGPVLDDAVQFVEVARTESRSGIHKRSSPPRFQSGEQLVSSADCLEIPSDWQVDRFILGIFPLTLSVPLSSARTMNQTFWVVEAK